MPTDNLISSLRAGDEVRGIFACVRKDRLKTRTGSPYLALELRDRSGSLQARAFRDADLLAGRFERGDLVSVVGRIESFRDQLVVEVTDIRRYEPEGGGAGTASESVAADGANLAPDIIEQFLPVTYRDMEELDGFLEHLAREVYDPGYRALLDAMLADTALREALRRTPCTRNGHHAYLGGLLEHTVAVATLARETCDLHPRLNSDLLITAAIVHDFGKIREFTYGAEIGLSEAGRMLGHLQLGQQLLLEWFARVQNSTPHAGAVPPPSATPFADAPSADPSQAKTRIGANADDFADASEARTVVAPTARAAVPSATAAAARGEQLGAAGPPPRPAGRGGELLSTDKQLALLHCVLCHHGSASAPGGRFRSPEALALYRLNTLDAAVKGALEHGLYPQPG